MTTLAEKLAGAAAWLADAAARYAASPTAHGYREVYEAEVAVECAALALRRSMNAQLIETRIGEDHA